jgi:hypothetical protein
MKGTTALKVEIVRPFGHIIIDAIAVTVVLHLLQLLSLVTQDILFCSILPPFIPSEADSFSFERFAEVTGEM